MTNLFGRRVVLRPLVTGDFHAWREVRLDNEDWLLPWEPSRPPGVPDAVRDKDAFAVRCNARQRERQLGIGYAFGVFVDGQFAGEVNLTSVQRGPFQSGTIGYWMSRQQAGRGYTPEAVVAVLRYAFEELHLHRIEIAIVPRNDKSLRVVEKLGIRQEGLAVEFLEINGAWEDHFRFGIVEREWFERRDELLGAWIL